MNQKKNAGRGGGSAIQVQKGHPPFYYRVDNLIPGEHFVAEVWMRRQSKGGMMQVLCPSLETPQFEWQVRKTFEAPEGDWIKLHLDLTVPARMAGKSLHFTLQASGQDSVVWFDDFRLERYPMRLKDTFHRKGILTDKRDGKSYPIVQVAGNWWMAEDLTYKRKDGFYTFDEARNAVPEGWRIPTEEDWNVLERMLGIPENALKATGGRGTNLSTRLLEGGDLGLDFVPTTEEKAHPYWTSTQASDSSHWARFLPRHTGIGRAEVIDLRRMKVRCVMDR